MEQKIWQVIGLMSGTSLDGVDLVFVKIKKELGYSFELLKTETIPYSEKWKKNLQEAFHFSGEKLTGFDAAYGKFLAGLVSEFIKKNGLKNIDFISSHGHTIFHRPEQNFTLQIGNGPEICAHTGLKVICDFRKQDVALGGQGAPLVPIGDRYLFDHYTFCLNLGGFSNISFEKSGERQAFDIAPVNIVLNHYAEKLGFAYDKNGELSRSGHIHRELLADLNNLEFYRTDKPKSLGYEFVVETVFPMLDKYGLSAIDVLATFTEHTAMQMAGVLNNKAEKNKASTVLVTGGGALNTYLVERLQAHTGSELIIPDREIIDYKEAIIFALLGVLKDQNEINCLKSVTGARINHSSGVIYTLH
jgi:anhydro-N-acetylmuramic acid kinase